MSRASASGFLAYCEIFKMAFLKILDFLRGLKIRSKAPARYNLVMAVKVKTVIECYFL